MATEHIVERVSTKLNDPCLKSAADDEPIFVLRAQDMTAAITVVFWILCTLIVGLMVRSDKLAPSDNTLRAAFEQALRMRRWERRKLPD
jgi:hypothetical protein